MDELGAMFGIYSSGPRLAWLWIIEYLSSFPQIDTSIIRGLIEAAPVLPDDLGKDTSEMVALRCLEELFGPKDGPGNVAPNDSRVVFDLSSSCEDVLDHILQEIPLSNLKKAGPELLRWDVQPFIRHKRTSLPKCALEQLKASILEQIPVLDGDENGPTSRFNDSDDENGNNQEGNLIPQITENDNEALQDGLLERNLLPSERFRNDIVAGNLVGLVSVNQDNMHYDLHLNAKKFKKDAMCTIQSAEGESGKLIKVTEIEGHNFGKDSQAGEGDQDVQVASRILEQNNAVSNLELQENWMGNVQNSDADVMVEQKYVDRHCQNVVTDEYNYVENGSLQKGSSGDTGENIDQGFPSSCPNSTFTDGLQQNIDPNQAKIDMGHPCVEQICENEDERFNIALKKSLFLSSQCRPHQDPVGQAEWTEQNFCVKCKQYGQVLVCNCSSCPLVVRKSCMGSAAKFDDKDNFYGPFCAYSLSISEYLEAKDKASLARKELAAFMELCLKGFTEEQRKLQRHSRLNDDEEIVRIQENGHLGDREHNFISQNREVNHGPSASCLNCNKLCVEETSTSGAVDVQGENNEGEENVVFGELSRGEHELEELPANLNSNRDSPTSENNETVPINQVEVEGDIVKEAVEPQIIDPPEKTACALRTDEEESSTDAKDKFIISSYSIRPRKRGKKYSFPPAPQLRRNKVPWTNDEEEMLRKGVQKFANNGGTVPWNRILDFGSKTFMRSRTTVDLKDKWRNMCKGGPKRRSGDVRA